MSHSPEIRNKDSPEAPAHIAEIPTTFWLLVRTLGIVYGDISTSPIYVFKEVFFNAHFAIPRTPENVIGVCSLIFWELLLIIGIKYCLLIMRVDNHGEGGIFAPLALIKRLLGKNSPRWTTAIILFGVALLLGDGVITPVISNYSATEGFREGLLEFAKRTPLPSPVRDIAITSAHYANPTWMTIIILVALFLFQARGTQRVSKIFGPITLVWLMVLIATGIPPLIRHPEVLEAIYNPFVGIQFLIRHQLHGFLVLGAVVLVITGGEALWADMGHFGARAIRMSWFSMVFPALMINYLGQGALLMSDAPILEGGKVFFSLAPWWGLLPLTILTTTETVIASQALISGSYSLVQQGIPLGCMPRLEIRHTSDAIAGQIYIPHVNWLLCAGCLALTLAFRTSSDLAAAYGLAVTGTMAITTIAFSFVAIRCWQWSPFLIVPLGLFLGAIDITLFVANLPKFFQGGFVPILLGLVLWYMMIVWHEGRERIAQAYEGAREHRMTIKRLAERLEERKRQNILPMLGPMVCMCSRPIEQEMDRIPIVLDTFWDWFRGLPERILILHIEQQEKPYARNGRYRIKEFCPMVISVVASFGYREHPNIRQILADLKRHGETPISHEGWIIAVNQEHLILKPKKVGYHRSSLNWIPFSWLRNAITSISRIHFHLGELWMLFNAHFFRMLLTRIDTPAHVVYFGLEEEERLLPLTAPIDYLRNPPRVIELPREIKK